MDTLKTILNGASLVEWAPMEKHVAKSGKVKDVLKGIPSKAFWHFWQRHKAALKKLGVTLWAEREKAPTGEYVTRKGKSRAVVRKQWEVTIWMNKHNSATLAAAGFTPSPDPF